MKVGIRIVIVKMVFFEKITVEDIPPFLFFEEERGLTKGGEKIKLMKLVSDLEKRWILTKLKECSWRREKAAELLGLTRKMLTTRIAKYKIKLPEK